MPRSTASDKTTLYCKGLGISFKDAQGLNSIRALDGVDLTCPPGQLHVVTGPSGSGKSVLLYAISGLAPAQTGTVHWDDLELSALPESGRDGWRRKNVGFVFQTFHLIGELDALDNVLLPVWFGQLRAGPMKQRAIDLLSDLGVPEGRGPVRFLSRGEQQRVAFARSLIFDPPITLADEPTASLDAAAGETVIQMLLKMAHDDGRTVIAVSHDPALIAAADRLVHMDHGRTIAPGEKAGDQP